MNTNRPTKPHEPLRESVDNRITQRTCDGECVNGFVALLCDSVDNEAYCPNDGSCCDGSGSNVQPTSPRPVSFT